MTCRPPWRWLLPAIVLCLPGQLPAYTVEPNMLVLGPGGSDSSAFLRLANRSMKPAAVEVVVNEFRRDLDGRGILGRQADEQFIIYPAQLVLMPGDEAGVQVRWTGAAPAAEQAFALTTREVVIPSRDVRSGEGPAGEDTTGARISVNVLMNYDIRVYVRPRGARPRVAVEAVTARAGGAAGPDLLEITLLNQGTAHQPLREMTLSLLALGADGTPLRQPPVTLTSQQVPGMSAALLAGDRRRLIVTRPPALPPGPVRALLTD